jgi:hypothetical protein
MLEPVVASQLVSLFARMPDFCRVIETPSALMIPRADGKPTYSGIQNSHAAQTTSTQRVENLLALSRASRSRGSDVAAILGSYSIQPGIAR